MADKIKFLPLIGLGYLLTAQQRGKGHYRGEQQGKYKTYDSGIYNIRFEYPASWVQNKNYSERYEGTDGFFEVADIQGIGRTIDEVANQEIDTPISPYGKEPQIEAFELGGEPARLILPSSDQAKVFGREAALIVKNKRPVIEGQEKYHYTIIWSDLKNMGHIIKTFKFV
ncbi:MAG: hypothetical protein ACRDDX_16070 [Cellulosilyticaceae bacterium]